MAGRSKPRPDIVQPYRDIDNLSEWCSRRLAAIHRGRYSHLDDESFWETFRDTLHQWADDEAWPDPHVERDPAGARGWRWWEYATHTYTRLNDRGAA